MAVGYQERTDVELVVVIDCVDIERVAAFWTAALGYSRVDGVGPYASLLPPGGNGVEVLLQRVAEPKRHKNRLHLDLRVPDLDAEVDRLEGLGARLLTSHPISEGRWTWHVLADPEDNEFCVLRPR